MSWCSAKLHICCDKIMTCLKMLLGCLSSSFSAASPYFLLPLQTQQVHVLAQGLPSLAMRFVRKTSVALVWQCF